MSSTTRLLIFMLLCRASGQCAMTNSSSSSLYAYLSQLSEPVYIANFLFDQENGSQHEKLAFLIKTDIKSVQASYQEKWFIRWEGRSLEFRRSKLQSSHLFLLWAQSSHLFLLWAWLFFGWRYLCWEFLPLHFIMSAPAPLSSLFSCFAFPVSLLIFSVFFICF